MRSLVGYFFSYHILWGRIQFICFGSLVVYFSLSCMMGVCKPLQQQTLPLVTIDTSLRGTIAKQIVQNGAELYFPKSVQRFYSQNGNRLAWVAPDTVKTHAGEAMLLIDCVIQFGLNHNDYHPGKLLYDELHRLTEHFDRVTVADKVNFDMMLTDAMLGFMNHLHYGKFNPVYSTSRIDNTLVEFDAVQALKESLQKKEFMVGILSAQPQTEAYKKLQYHTHLMAGVYTGDCYETPEGDLRTMAINLERMRWVNNGNKTFININIPSYSLVFHLSDTVYRFNVIVGKPVSPTPTLQSTITHFTTAPEWKVSKEIVIREIIPKALNNRSYLENNHYSIYTAKGEYVEPTQQKLKEISVYPQKYLVRQSLGCDNSLGRIAFRFNNPFDIYLHDTPNQNLFSYDQRAFSHGCIRLQGAEILADLVLKNDGQESRINEVHKAIINDQIKDFKLRKPLPINVTYITCEMKNGVLIRYKDIYQLDKALEMAMYNQAMVTR